jgi:hypothetical protein
MALSRADIEAVANRVVELLQDLAAGCLDAPAQLVDAATVARLLGVSRATVYANADQLGAIRLGTGKRARLRFDATRLLSTDPRAELGRAGHPTARWRGAAIPTEKGNHLLPIRGAAAGEKRRRLSAESGS